MAADSAQLVAAFENRLQTLTAKLQGKNAENDELNTKLANIISQAEVLIAENQTLT
jgi:hypothetical protein